MANHKQIVAIRKVGTSCAIVLPKSILEAQRLKLGDELFLTPTGEHTIVMVRVPKNFYDRLKK